MLDELFVPTQSERREREKERARLLIKLSFTRVNYPDGMSGKLIAIVEALFVRPTRRLINVTVLLCNHRFFSLFLSNYTYLYFFNLHFPGVVYYPTSNIFSFDIILHTYGELDFSENLPVSRNKG